MTWFADEVIAPANERVLRAVEHDPVLAPFAYVLTNPFEHRWPRPDTIHDFGTDGLVVIRPVCDPNADDFKTDWYGETLLDWRTILPAEDTPLVITPGRV